jgi:hypothetical protein
MKWAGGMGKKMVKSRKPVRKMIRKTLRKSSLRRHAGSFLVNITKTEKDNRMLLLGMIGDETAAMKSAKRPTSNQLKKILYTMNSSVSIGSVIGDLAQYDQLVNDEELVRSQLFKIMILQLIDLMIKESKKEGNDPQINMIETLINRMTINTSNGFRLPIDHQTIDHGSLIRLINLQRKQSGGMGPLAQVAATAPFAATQPFQAAPSQVIFPEYPSTRTFGNMYPQMTYPTGTKPVEYNIQRPSSQVAVETSKTPFDFYGDNVAITPIARVSSNQMLNAAHPEAKAVQLLKGIASVSTPPTTLTPTQKTLLTWVDKFYQSTGLSLPYHPFKPVDPIVTDIMKNKFGFIRQHLEKLKRKLAIHAPERFEVLQYNSFVNILHHIRIGHTKLVNEMPKNILHGRKKVIDPSEIKRSIIDLANYNSQYDKIYVYVERKPPSTIQRLGLFGESINYVIEKIYILYTKTTGNDMSDYYIPCDPTQFDSDFIPFAFRFMWSSEQVLNIQDIMKSVDGYLTLEPSFSGFWNPNTPTSSILAKLQGSDQITKNIISDVGKFTQLAIQLTHLRYSDYLVSTLDHVVQDPSKAIELREQSNALQAAIAKHAADVQIWSGDTSDELVTLAANMAVTAGKLDMTLKEDRAVTEFFQNMTHKFGGALRDSIDGVAEAAEFFGGAVRGVTKSANQMIRNFLRTETLTMFMFLYLQYFNSMGLMLSFGTVGIAPLIPAGIMTTAIVAGEQAVKEMSFQYVQPGWSTSIVMLFLIYTVYDKSKAVSAVGSIKELVQMCRGAAVGQPIRPKRTFGEKVTASPLAQAPILAPVPNVAVKPVATPRKSRFSKEPAISQAAIEATRRAALLQNAARRGALQGYSTTQTSTNAARRISKEGGKRSTKRSTTRKLKRTSH